MRETKNAEKKNLRQNNEGECTRNIYIKKVGANEGEKIISYKARGRGGKNKSGGIIRRKIREEATYAKINK